ncbi:MAG: preprotein translocase subunit SecD [Oscillospiraceae bacterium]|nr:preprotein translocase subunit SecD [Oscillospiraceae bacterium]
MKRVKKPVFFLVFALIMLFAASVMWGLSNWYGDIETVWIKGVEDIRFGIDIKGGVDVTFGPPEGFDATNEQLDAAKEVIVQRMLTLGITDYETYLDYSADHIIVRFPWKQDETDFDPEAAVKELGETARLTFREGNETDSDGAPSGVTAENIILEGADVAEAYAAYDQSQSEWEVALRLDDSGTQKFADATAKLYEEGGSISIWMDDTMISAPRVNAVISDGNATITGSFDAESATKLANQINSGALPFKLETTSFSTISPSLGQGALSAMVLAGIIAFAVIAVYMLIMYRLPGFIAVVCLIGQVAGTLAFVSGYFGFREGSILTIPGIAGIILAVGMGVDANVITAERIREELAAGKSLAGSLRSGYSRAFSAILDGNVTMILVAIILMGAFGTTDSIWAKLLHFAFFMFGPTTAGTIYSFGYTLMTGTVLNLFFGVFCARLMTMSLSEFKIFKKPSLYGGAK